MWVYMIIFLLDWHCQQWCDCFSKWYVNQKHSKTNIPLKTFILMPVKGARLVISPLFEEQSAGTKIFPSHLATFLSSNFSISLFLLGFMTVTLLMFEFRWCFSNSNVHTNHLGILWNAHSTSVGLAWDSTVLTSCQMMPMCWS